MNEMAAYMFAALVSVVLMPVIAAGFYHWSSLLRAKGKVFLVRMLVPFFLVVIFIATPPLICVLIQEFFFPPYPIKPGESAGLLGPELPVLLLWPFGLVVLGIYALVAFCRTAQIEI